MPNESMVFGLVELLSLHGFVLVNNFLYQCRCPNTRIYDHTYSSYHGDCSVIKEEKMFL